jgi:hypothetical protein
MNAIAPNQDRLGEVFLPVDFRADAGGLQQMKPSPGTVCTFRLDHKYL